MFDISVIIPGIRPENWARIYEELDSTFKKNKFEVIFIGPKIPSNYFDDKLNFRYVRDFGHPSRCVQLGATLSAGEYICWIGERFRSHSPIKVSQNGIIRSCRYLLTEILTGK